MTCACGHPAAKDSHLCDRCCRLKKLALTDIASDEEIKKAYHHQAQKEHPDHHKKEDEKKATERFNEIKDAYEYLLDHPKLPPPPPAPPPKPADGPEPYDIADDDPLPYDVPVEEPARPPYDSPPPSPKAQDIPRPPDTRAPYENPPPYKPYVKPQQVPPLNIFARIALPLVSAAISLLIFDGLVFLQYGMQMSFAQYLWTIAAILGVVIDLKQRRLRYSPLAVVLLALLFFARPSLYPGENNPLVTALAGFLCSLGSLLLLGSWFDRTSPFRRTGFIVFAGIMPLILAFTFTLFRSPSVLTNVFAALNSQPAVPPRVFACEQVHPPCACESKTSFRPSDTVAFMIAAPRLPAGFLKFFLPNGQKQSVWVAPINVRSARACDVIQFQIPKNSGYGRVRAALSFAADSQVKPVDLSFTISRPTRIVRQPPQ